MRCKYTRDEASSKVAEALRFGLFGKGHTAQCRCSAGECTESQCDAIYVHDSTGRRVATLHGTDVRATILDGGHLAVYRMPNGGSTRDEERLLSLQDALVQMNRRNAEFWARKDE